MIKKLRLFRVKASSCSPLGDLDDIYACAISQLPIRTRKEYCQRLIKRIKFELKTASCRQKKQQLKKIIESATLEISKLEPNAKN
ncbi:hypothetical protein [Maribacter cobaltidurans]|uniref:Uncharacterized protein n=1 Tax=Maribacter cobaltidurans TaxID=1178778 RepID=A0A223V102_9FLAO|nr:hypothetical protein [Maribacter cobaltidurans]ASV28996.1 hypothetical protein CJ263_01430 [Maribacter cobaltidurans]GGD72844.1 hypothetical protein GCM10011412_08080 [Maribacter cobaltidurans]